MDGTYSQGQVRDGVMAQAAEGDALDLMVGSPMRIERKRLPGLAVPYGVPVSIRNRLDYVDVFWPAGAFGAIAFDSFPARDDSTLLPGGVRRGDYFHSQAVRRRAVLARQSIAYVWRHDGDPAITVEHVGAAHRFVQEHKDDPATESDSPLERTSYERSLTANQGLAYDEKLGVGVRVRPDGVDTSEADERARLERINAAPMYRDGEPIDKE